MGSLGPLGESYPSKAQVALAEFVDGAARLTLVDRHLGDIWQLYGQKLYPWWHFDFSFR